MVSLTGSGVKLDHLFDEQPTNIKNIPKQFKVSRLVRHTKGDSTVADIQFQDALDEHFVHDVVHMFRAVAGLESVPEESIDSRVTLKAFDLRYSDLGVETIEALGLRWLKEQNIRYDWSIGGQYILGCGSDVLETITHRRSGFTVKVEDGLAITPKYKLMNPSSEKGAVLKLSAVRCYTHGLL